MKDEECMCHDCLKGPPGGLSLSCFVIATFSVVRIVNLCHYYLLLDQFTGTISYISDKIAIFNFLMEINV